MTTRSTSGAGAFRTALAIALLGAAVAALPVAAQVPQLPPPPEDLHRPFSLSLGPGVTANLTRPGDWTTTLTLALGWAIDGRWTVSVGPYWEREFDHVDGVPWVYDELSIALGASYAFAPHWTVSVEVDLGLVHDAYGPWERNPEYGVGVGVSRAFPIGERWNVVVGPELSWKISDAEWSIGLNTGVSFEF